ncbi:MAG: phosphate acyltransferase [bacterium]|nr:MAG: phosphate acyltransferase [bacterium]
MKIAVDVMSGENPPETLIRGALKAVEESNIEVVLVGDEATIHKELEQHSQANEKISVVHASEIIAMDESPAKACRKKKDSSVMVAGALVAKKKADGFFSPGNTGATLASSLMNIKRVEGVKRPALATILPTVKGYAIILDAGANVDSDPEHLAQFAIMGEIFMQKILEIPEPRIGLLNIGEEDKKGNELSQKAFEIIKTIDFNFIGNIEGHDIYEGDVDIIVCDGFIGNIVLKLSEGLGSVVMRLIKNEMIKNYKYRLGAFMARDALRSVKERFNPATYGGAPLLGINGCALVGHGNTGELATTNAIITTAKMANAKLDKLIKKSISQYSLSTK